MESVGTQQSLICHNAESSTGARCKVITEISVCQQQALCQEIENEKKQKK